MKTFSSIILLIFLVACQSNGPQPTATSAPVATLPPEPPQPIMTATTVPATATPQPEFTLLSISRNDNQPVERASDVAYTNPIQSGIATQRVDLYRPVSSGPWPTVILIHGSGSGKGDIADWAEDAAASGLLVYAANWPVPPLSSINSSSEKRLREAHESVGCLVQFALATASSFQGETETLVLAGFSAGALQGSATALSGPSWQTKWDNWSAEVDGPEAQTGCLYEGDGTSWVTAFVGVGGPYGLYNGLMGNPAGLSSRERGLYDLVSPGALLENGVAIPLRIVHGSGDGRVQLSQSENYALAAVRAGYNSQLVVVEGAGHTTINGTTVPIIHALATGSD